MFPTAFCTVTTCPWGVCWEQKQSPCENPARANSGTVAPVLLTWMCCGILTLIRKAWLTSARNSRIMVANILVHVCESGGKVYLRDG